MTNKHNPTDTTQSPEQAPSLLESICGKNGYDEVLPEAEEAVAKTEPARETGFMCPICQKKIMTGDILNIRKIQTLNNTAEIERQRDMLLGIINGQTKAPTAGDVLSLVLLGELDRAKGMLSNICSIHAAAIKECEESK